MGLGWDGVGLETILETRRVDPRGHANVMNFTNCGVSMPHSVRQNGLRQTLQRMRHGGDFGGACGGP